MLDIPRVDFWHRPTVAGGAVLGTSLPLVEAVTTTVYDSSAEVGPMVLNKLSFFLFSPTCWLLPPSSVAKDNKMHFGHKEPASINYVRNRLTKRE